MNGLCNLNKVVYQGIIYPKENVKDKKTYIGISVPLLLKPSLGLFGLMGR